MSYLCSVQRGRGGAARGGGHGPGVVCGNGGSRKSGLRRPLLHCALRALRADALRGIGGDDDACCVGALSSSFKKEGLWKYSVELYYLFWLRRAYIAPER